MKCFYPILIITFIGIISCSNNRNGDKDSLNSGIDTVREYHENGRVKSESIMVNGKIVGHKNVYFTSGQKAGFYSYENGLRKGVFETYHENGKLRTKGFFKNDSTIDGELKIMDTTGMVIKVLLYENGIIIDSK
jgi:antitoxin component YwqK of YwqJK toxin-antitoxin module